MYRIRFQLFSGQSGDVRLLAKKEVLKFIRFCFGNSLTGRMIYQAFNTHGRVDYDIDGITFKVSKINREV